MILYLGIFKKTIYTCDLSYNVRYRQFRKYLLPVFIKAIVVLHYNVLISFIGTFSSISARLIKVSLPLGGAAAMTQ